MTKDTMAVQALLEKSADTDFLRDMIGFAAQRLMDLEVGGLTGAAYGERSAERLAPRGVGWSMSATMTAQLATDALMIAIWRR